LAISNSKASKPGSVIISDWHVAGEQWLFTRIFTKNEAVCDLIIQRRRHDVSLNTATLQHCGMTHMRKISYVHTVGLYALPLCAALCLAVCWCIAFRCERGFSQINSDGAKTATEYTIFRLQIVVDWVRW